MEHNQCAQQNRRTVKDHRKYTKCQMRTNFTNGHCDEILTSS